LCQAITGGLGCQSDGRCIPVTVPGLASLRVFDTLAVHVSVTLDQATTPIVSDVATAALSSYVVVDATTHTLNVLSAGATLRADAVSFAAGQHYTLVLFEDTQGHPTEHLIDEDVGLPPTQAQSLIQYVQGSPVLPLEDLRFGATTLLGGVGLDELRAPIAVTARTDELAVGGSAGGRSVMGGSVTLVGGSSYLVVTWGGASALLPETTVLDTSGVIARLHGAGIRLANATADVASLRLLIESEPLVGGASATVMPAKGYMLLERGAHHLRLANSQTPSTIFYDANPVLASGGLYTLIGGGTAADASTPLTAVLASDQPTTPTPAGQVSVAIAHFSPSEKNDTVLLQQSDNGGAPTALTTATSFATASDFATTTLGSTSAWRAQFQGGDSQPAIGSGTLALTGGSAYTVIVMDRVLQLSFWLLGPRGTVLVAP
jgi:hypothetical protein